MIVFEKINALPHLIDNGDLNHKHKSPSEKHKQTKTSWEVPVFKYNDEELHYVSALRIHKSPCLAQNAPISPLYRDNKTVAYAFFSRLRYLQTVSQTTIGNNKVKNAFLTAKRERTPHG